MLTATFRAPKTGEPVKIRAEFLRAVGASLRDGDDNEIAIQVKGVWHSDGRAFLSLTVEGPVHLRFENPTFGEAESIGPLYKVQLIYNGLWAAANAEPVQIADFDLTLDAWRLRIRPGVAMPVLTISPA